MTSPSEAIQQRGNIVAEDEVASQLRQCAQPQQCSACTAVEQHVPFLPIRSSIVALMSIRLKLLA